MVIFARQFNENTFYRSANVNKALVDVLNSTGELSYLAMSKQVFFVSHIFFF